jgi:signal peptidase II
LKTFFSRYGFLFLVTGGVILLDQVAKWLIRSRFGMWSGDGPWNILGLELYLVHMPNTGMMFSLLQGAGLVITILGLVVAGILIYSFPKISRQNGLERWGVALLLGGILGNLIDRVALGYITDFVRIDPLPVFNFADLAVYSGVILLAVGVLLEGKKKPPPVEQVTPPAE